MVFKLKKVMLSKRMVSPKIAVHTCFIGNGPNTVSGSTGPNTELSEFLCSSLSSGERAQWVPRNLLFVCRCKLTEFFAELTEFGAELSEFSLPKQHSRNSIPPVSHVKKKKACLSQRKLLWVRRGCQASQRKGWPRGKFGELPGKFGKLLGKFGKLPGNLRIAVKFHSERTSGEVAENFRGSSGNFRGSFRRLPRSSGVPDSLPATRQICLQLRPCIPSFSKSLHAWN